MAGIGGINLNVPQSIGDGGVPGGFNFNAGLGLVGQGVGLQQGISNGDAAAIASAIGGAIGSVIPGIGTLIGSLAGRAIGTVAQKVAGGAKKHRTDVPAINLTYSSPSMDAYALFTGDWRITRNRNAQHKLPEFEKQFFTAINETKTRLKSLGMTDMLEWVDGHLADYNKKKGELGPVETLRTGTVQALANIVQGAEAIIEKRFDEAEASGLDPKMRQEFNRQTEKRMFDIHADIINKEVQSALKDQKLTEQHPSAKFKINRGDKDTVLNKDGSINFGKISGENNTPLFNARLGKFFNENFTDIRVNPPVDVQARIDSVMAEFDRKNPLSSSAKHNSNNKRRREAALQQAMSDANLAAEHNRDYTEFNELPLSDNAKALNTPITDITNFLSSFNPPEPQPDINDPVPDGDTGSGDGTTDDPDFDTNVPGTDTVPGTDIPANVDNGTGDEPPAQDDNDIDLNIPVGGTGGTGGSGNVNPPRMPLPNAAIDFSIPFGEGSVNNLTPVQTSVSRPNLSIPTRQFGPVQIKERTPIAVQQTPGILSNIKSDENIQTSGLLTRR